MQRRHSQLGRRKNAASPRRLALRRVLHDVSTDVLQQLSVGPDNSTGTQETPPAESPSTATDIAVLDVASLHSLHQMFLLLYEWDSEIANRHSSAKKSSQECEISVDRKTY